MRLIDADALLENYSLKDAVKYGNKTAEQQHNSYSTLMLYEVADMINDAPTIDAEPVRHSSWVYANNRKTVAHISCDMHCPVCRSVFVRVDGERRFKRCPNCGAKMMEVQE